MLQLLFEGANDVLPRAREPSPHLSHFFLGSDPALWRTGVRSYGEVVYEDLYRGVDLIYRATPTGVKYEFHLLAGVSPEDITLVYDGADGIEIDGAGNAWIQTSVGSLTDSAPIAYQGADRVPCAFVPRGPRSYGLRCQGVEGSKPLVIDPLLTATFLGGPGADGGTAIAVDADGNAYVTGETESANFTATLGSFDETLNGTVDAFVAKLDRTLSSLIYMTYLGGGGEDRGRSIAVDTLGAVYVTGNTSSDNFPFTPNANDTALGGPSDAFVASLNATGAALLYASYLGGRGADGGNSVAVAPGGSVFLTGDTSSDDFPWRIGANDTTLGGASDAFVAKLNVTGGSLDYATYLGGSGNDSGLSIAVDSGGNAYVTGQVDSASFFPVTAGVVQETYGGGPGDAFVAMVNPAGTSLVYATFLGGSGLDEGSGIAVDGAGNAYVTGSTVEDVTNFTTTNGANDTTHNGVTDAFVAKVDPTGTALLYATFLGGAKRDYGYGIAVDRAGNAYVAGDTNSADFPPTPDANSTQNRGARDGFVTRLGPGGVVLDYSTYLGGRDLDFARSIALDSAGNAYVTGETQSSNFPSTFGAWDTDLDDSSADVNNWKDAFVAKFVWPSDLSVVPADIAFVPPLAVNPGEDLIIEATVHNEGVGVASAVRVRFFDGPPTGGFPIGTDQLIPQIGPFGGTGRASVTWTAWPSGAHDICVVVDSGDGIDELNESNNEACATIQVIFGPITALLIGQPNHTAPETYVTSVTPLSLSVLDRNGTGIRFTRYRIDNAPLWIDYVGPFSLLSEGEHLLGWYSEDNTGTREVARSARLRVDDTPPSTTLAIGEPKFVAADTFVNSSTALALAAADGGATPVGVALTEYRLDGDGAWTPYAAPLTLVGADGPRTLEYRATDLLGNNVAGVLRVVLDNTPPATTYTPDQGPFTTATRFTLSASDAGSGVDRIEYQVDNGSWIPYEVSFSLPAGDHVVVHRAWDRLNNQAVERAFLVTIVATPAAPFPLIWIVLAVTVSIAVSISWLYEYLRRSFWVPFAVLWARLTHGDILDHEKRGMVVGYLAANPAANFAAIRADLKMAMGTLTYHLWVLEKEGEIKSWRDGRFRRYAPYGHRVAEMQPRLTDIELLLLQRIRGTSGLTQKELAKDVGVSQPAVSYHISRMAALGVLRVERKGRAKRYTANLGDVPGDAGSQADRGSATDPEPVDETDDWGAPR